MAIKYISYDPNVLEDKLYLITLCARSAFFATVITTRCLNVLSVGMPLYEVESQEVVGKNSNHNLVLRGECLSACAYLKDKGVKVDLVYIDPPFASGADYAKKVYIRRNPKVAEGY